MSDNLLDQRFTWLQQTLLDSMDRSATIRTCSRIANLLDDVKFLMIISQKLKTETVIRGFLQSCLNLLSVNVLADHPKLSNLSKHLDDFAACLDLYNYGLHDESACCVECGQSTIIHGHIDRGGVDYYDNYISWCTNCYWAWHREDYAMTGSEGPIAAFNYQTNTYD